MTPIEIVLSLLMIATVGLMVWQMRRPAADAGSSVELERENAKLHASLEQAQKEVGKLQSELEAQKGEYKELQGKGKQLSVQFTETKNDLDHAKKEAEDLQKKLAKHEAAAERHEKERAAELAKLEAAKLSLDQERQRVIREDEEKLRQAEEERDRVWADHEKNVIAQMTDLCKQPQYAFSCFTNTNLPEGFDGSLKPDFMIEFIDQYIIFDAKKSKSESLSTYIANTVKTTVAKVKKNPKIATMIFLVVPTEAIGELKTHHHVHDGYTLYVVSPEALAPILASLKRITAYEFAEQMDPQERDNIIQLITDFAFHINLRNAADLVLTKLGAEALHKAQRLAPALAEEVAQRQQPMNAKVALSAAELKKLVVSVAAQETEVDALAAPRALVDGTLVKAVKAAVSPKAN
jgi:myosin heavy subunit